MAPSNIGIKEIAATAGVSIATVSRYLSGKTVRPAYRDRVQAALSELDYRPNLGARRLRSGDAGLIGLIVADIGNPFFVALIQAIETLAWRNGRRVILCNSDEDPVREALLVAMLEDERVSGIIMAPALGSVAPNTSTPVVLVDRKYPDHTYDAVILDNAGAAASLVDRLCDRNCSRILGLFGEAGVTAQERRVGFAAEVERRGVPLMTAGIPYAAAGCRRTVRQVIEDSAPDAIVCGDSLILLEAAITVGDTRPSEVQLAGFDEADWLRLIRPIPIVVVQPVDEIAHAALALLIARIDGEGGDPGTVAFKGCVTRSRSIL